MVIQSENLGAKVFKENMLYIRFVSELGMTFTIITKFFQHNYVKPNAMEAYMQNAIISQKWDEIR